MYLGISEDVSRAKTNNSLKFPRDLPRLSAQMYLVLSKSGATAVRNSWNAGPAMKIVTEFEHSLKKYPPIAPGTPDPYMPPQ
jgi:hypothetical protein